MEGEERQGWDSEVLDLVLCSGGLKHSGVSLPRDDTRCIAAILSWWFIERLIDVNNFSRVEGEPEVVQPRLPAACIILAGLDNMALTYTK